MLKSMNSHPRLCIRIPSTWPTRQSKRMGREGRHIPRICAIAVAADALHQQYDLRT